MSYRTQKCPFTFKYWAVANAITGKPVQIHRNFLQHMMQGLGYSSCFHKVIDSSATWGQATFGEVKS